jgi:AcrR family transcriptional regulator
MAFSISAHESSLGWQERALRRSLDSAHARSVDRITRLVGAARDLANDTGSAAFTVAQVARRAGLSIKLFYRCFGGKDELLLALIEEDSRLGAALLAEEIADRSRPVERLRCYVEGIFGLLTHPGAVGYAGVLVREYRRLSELYPDELRTALAPLVGLLSAELAAAADDGVAAVEDPHRAAELVFGVLLSGISEVTLGRADPLELADWVWRFCWSGMRGDALTPHPGGNKRAPDEEGGTPT